MARKTYYDLAPWRPAHSNPHNLHIMQVVLTSTDERDTPMAIPSRLAPNLWRLAIDGVDVDISEFPVMVQMATGRWPKVFISGVETLLPCDLWINKELRASSLGSLTYEPKDIRA